MPEYIYLIHPMREGFFEQPTPEENTIMEEHFQYLDRAAKAGVVVLAGPCLDDTFGVVILRAPDDAAARDFMFNDPSIRQNIMLAEIHPMRISIRDR
jgi:uncharacterized protein